MGYDFWAKAIIDKLKESGEFSRPSAPLVKCTKCGSYNTYYTKKESFFGQYPIYKCNKCGKKFKEN